MGGGSSAPVHSTPAPPWWRVSIPLFQDVSVLPQDMGDSEVPRKKSRLDNRNNNGVVVEKESEAKNVSTHDAEIVILDEDEVTEAPSGQTKGNTRFSHKLNSILFALCIVKKCMFKQITH